MAWQISATPVPRGDAPVDFWIDDDGRRRERPIPGAELLPGRYVTNGLTDAHAHPAIRTADTGPRVADPDEIRETLASWASAGVGVVRDTGSPGGVTLDVAPTPGLPQMLASGRFLAPQDRYFPALLPDPAPPERLTQLALGELARGARWVKVIADFPALTDGVPSGESFPTYETSALQQMIDAVHQAGGRVAAHCVTPLLSTLVGLGIDSVEHGTSMDEDTLAAMARTGAAWTPTLNALTAGVAESPPEVRVRLEAILDRLRELLPLARRLGVPVLTGTDTVGTIAGEIALLARMGLDPSEALGAATVSAYDFLGLNLDEPGMPVTVATYQDDPRADLAILQNPSAVIVGGVRVR